jgi:hypothetical protein
LPPHPPPFAHHFSARAFIYAFLTYS